MIVHTPCAKVGHRQTIFTKSPTSFEVGLFNWVKTFGYHHGNSLGMIVMDWLATTREAFFILLSGDVEL